MTKTIGSFDLASFKNLRDDVTQYFWFESDSSSAWGSGAHVTLYPESQFTDSTSPNYMKGQNIIMNTDGFSIRNGALPMMVLDNDSLDFNAVDTSLGTYTTMATFGLTGATIGQTSGAHSVIDGNGQRFYAGDGTTQLANIGYGEGTSVGGSDYAPYYTFGQREGTASQYSSSQTYAVGDICIYNNKLYVCRKAITTPKAWNSNDWQLVIGNYSVAEGMETTASGYYSHAEGIGTVAVGYFSHAEGNMTIAGFGSAHAEGEETKALGVGAHSEGYQTIASGYNAHAQGEGTIANRLASTAIGLYNISDTDGNNYTRGNYALIIGNGTADNARSNALTVDWNGNVDIASGASYSIGGVSIDAVEDISDKFTFTSAWSNLSCYAYKYGKLVVFSLEGYASTVVAGSQYTMVTIASGYRPRSTIYYTGHGTNSSFVPQGSVNSIAWTSGDITVRPQTSTCNYIFVSGVYVLS